ncbi:double-strand break repair helicase AddA [Shimia thalassica]|uniref:double-strand break repair helicase AddA n=1 Tax=Shimia thalassica TaxID=1715693 RepID=UPI0026E3BA1F|nr:double-strand break repair helicase AddA [Shimia thalassica]MDO6481694.1 double-strand break repair helicase AddA [Shimia thalassica]
MQRNDATERQVQAAQPMQSTWLSANAGSGKTRVLTDRVARLLLQGVLPQHILCLTYTKAAASEMQNRLFKRLGAWAMLEDQKLRDDLNTLGVTGPLDGDLLKEARTLFARAIETPGGLKIQTIHSFCSSLLRRFPLEAGVSPMFSEMEDRAAALLREEIVSSMASDEGSSVISDLARHFTGESLEDLTNEIVRSRHLFYSVPDETGVYAALGFDSPINAETLTSQAFYGGETELIADLITALRTGGATDNKNAEKLAQLSTIDWSALPVLEGVFLTGGAAKSPFSAKIGSFPTKGVQKNHPDLMARLEPLMLRVEDTRKARLAYDMAQRSQALAAFGVQFLEKYETRKQLLGWLDFDDLILRARALLSDPMVAEWVLFRLDGGIDHILVDEAQDTSPEQWQVIERLAQEFTSGSGARSDVERTIFVVGDKKQSIYSFQGADPAEFDRMRSEFDDRLKPTEKPLLSLELEYSFRSSAAVLRLVDLVFEQQEQAGFPQDMKHRAFHDDMPGRADLWPVVDESPKPDKEEWYKPVDRLGETHHSVVLADRIAAEIKRLIDDKETIPAEKGETGLYTQRPVQAGDFLILVQRRSNLFHEIIRACKAHDLPIAGADRLKVGAELAVRDLGALLSFLATPEDDLSLAVALRSPLFGWSEKQLYDLAQGRGGKLLWAALREQAETYPQTLEILHDLQAQADFLRPYDLIERILTRHKGRHTLLARLGVEAEDGINALLSQALAYERSAVPSLTGFLVWMETDDLEIKRQMDSAGNRIRVMTVHGSKGLEAPIVILPDTGKRLIRNDGQIIDREGIPLWSVSADKAPAEMKEERERKADLLRAERQRLLYVAMTRAEKWLITVAAGDLGKDGQTWYEAIQRGLETAGAEPFDFPGGQGLRYSHGDWSGPIVEENEETEVALPDLAAQFRTPVAPVDPVVSTLSPSDLGGAKALPGEAGLDEEAAMQWGSWVHLLLEHLPEHDRQSWPQAAADLLPKGPEGPSEAQLSALVIEATGVLSTPELSFLFEDDTLAEVPITANLGSSRIHGIIDRLIVTPDYVLVVDFKTNATVPNTPEQTPEGVLRQMGAYVEGLGQIYPDRDIRAAILWTKTAQLMTLPNEVVTKALTTAALS